MKTSARVSHKQKSRGSKYKTPHKRHKSHKSSSSYTAPVEPVEEGPSNFGIGGLGSLGGLEGLSWGEDTSFHLPGLGALGPLGPEHTSGHLSAPHHSNASSHHTGRGHSSQSGPRTYGKR